MCDLLEGIKSFDDYIRRHRGERISVIQKQKQKFSDIPQKKNCYRKLVRSIELEMLQVALLKTQGRNSKIKLIKKKKELEGTITIKYS